MSTAISGEAGRESSCEREAGARDVLSEAGLASGLERADCSSEEKQPLTGRRVPSRRARVQRPPLLRSAPCPTAGDRYNGVRSLTRVLQSPLGNTHIDELLEEGNGERAPPSDLVQPPLKDRSRRRGLTARKPQRDRGTGRVGLSIEPR